MVSRRKKTKAQLAAELETLQQQIAALQARESEQARTEAALRQSEERYRSLVEQAPDAIFTLASDGTITSLNRAFETITGWSRDDRLGKPYDPILHPPDVPLMQDLLQRVLQGETPSIAELRVRTQSGAYLVGELMMVPEIEGGKIVGVWGMLRNITPRKTLEQQRIDILAMLTHDIKNPLGVILGYADILLEEATARGATASEAMLRRLKGNVLTVHHLVTNHLDASRIETGHLALAKGPVVLNELLLQIGRQYEADAQHRHITLEFQLQEDLPVIQADGLTLERVFTNLIHNALKFTPEQGKITVSSSQPNPDVVSVAVADTGPGIPPEELGSIFEKYRQGERSGLREGTGLGLYIVQAFVNAHGGWVAVESTLGQGTRFSVYLPVTA